jgi:hypothetical protein
LDVKRGLELGASLVCVASDDNFGQRNPLACPQILTGRIMLGSY